PDDQENDAANGLSEPHPLCQKKSEGDWSCDSAPIPTATFRSKADVGRTFQTRDRRQCTEACSRSRARSCIRTQSKKPMPCDCQNVSRAQSREKLHHSRVRYF